MFSFRRMFFSGIILSCILVLSSAAFADIIYIPYDDESSVNYIREDSSGNFTETKNVIPKIAGISEGYPYYDRVAFFTYKNKSRVLVMRQESDEEKTLTIYDPEDFSTPISSKTYGEEYNGLTGHWSGISEYGDNVLLGKGNLLCTINPQTSELIEEPYKISDSYSHEFDFTVHDGLIYAGEYVGSFKTEIMDSPGNIIATVSDIYLEPVSSGSNLYCGGDIGIYRVKHSEIKGLNGETFQLLNFISKYGEQILSESVRDFCPDGNGYFYYIPGEVKGSYHSDDYIGGYSVKHYDGSKTTTVYNITGSEYIAYVVYDPVAKTLYIVTGTNPDGVYYSVSENAVSALKQNSSGQFEVVARFEGIFRNEDIAFVNMTSSESTPVEELKIESKIGKNGVIKAQYEGTATATGGTAPYKWKLSSGNLPTNVKLKYDKNTGVATLKGKPTEAGKFTFKLKVTDSNKTSLTKKFTITITAPEISGTFGDGVMKKSYSGTAAISGGTSPYTWTASGLPSGLALTQNAKGTKAYIKGKPTESGKFTFKLKAVDANKASITKKFTVTISAFNITGTFGDGVVKTTYKQTFAVF